MYASRRWDCHIASYFKKLQTQYKKWHNRVAPIMHSALCKKYGLGHTKKWCDHGVATVMENEHAKLPRDSNIQTEQHRQGDHIWSWLDNVKSSMSQSRVTPGLWRKVFGRTKCNISFKMITENSTIEDAFYTQREFYIDWLLRPLFSKCDSNFGKEQPANTLCCEISTITKKKKERNEMPVF